MNLLKEGHYRSSDRNISLALTMLFTGLAAGALTALLLAPKSGRRLRRDLRERLEDARESVGDQASEWAEKAKARITPMGKPFRRAV